VILSGLWVDSFGEVTFPLLESQARKLLLGTNSSSRDLSLETFGRLHPTPSREQSSVVVVVVD